MPISLGSRLIVVVRQAGDKVCKILKFATKFMLITCKVVSDMGSHIFLVDPYYFMVIFKFEDLAPPILAILSSHM